jgi:hypothetical protein
LNYLVYTAKKSSHEDEDEEKEAPSIFFLKETDNLRILNNNVPVVRTDTSEVI